MRKSWILSALCMILLFASTATITAQEPDKAYRESLKKMMVLLGALATVEDMVPRIMNMLKQQYPAVSEEFWTAQSAKWSTLYGEKLVDIYAPIYKKHLTLDELKQIVLFYESPVGKKLGEVTPTMAAEGMEVGQQLSVEMMTTLQEEIAAQSK
ncbi:MAG TPA: DUF2059 domain-containing protein [Bacteroides reticulotermitis]|nr:DUF2059 domain-containing protein [Bacteroides reticulotermitis]